MSVDRCELATGTNQLNWLACYLAVLDIDFEVVQPPELVTELRLLAERMSRAAAQPRSDVR